MVIAQDADGTTGASAPYGAVRDRAALDMLFGKCGLRYSVTGNSIIVMRVGPPQTGGLADTYVELWVICIVRGGHA